MLFANDPITIESIPDEALPSKNIFVKQKQPPIQITFQDVSYAFLRILDIIISYELFAYINQPSFIQFKNELKILKEQIKTLYTEKQSLETIQYKTPTEENKQKINVKSKEYNTKLREYEEKLKNYTEHVYNFFLYVSSLVLKPLNLTLTKYKEILNQIIVDFLVVYTEIQKPSSQFLIHQDTTMFNARILMDFKTLQPKTLNITEISDYINYPTVFTKIRLFNERLQFYKDLLFSDISKIDIKRGGKRRRKSRQPRKSRHKRRTKKTT